MELVKCNNLCKKFDDKQVLNNINLSIPKGKIIGLLGKNGMGKTTLIKLINDLLTPTSGEVLINGEKPGVNSKKIISYLPERTYLDKNMNVSQIITFFNEFYDNFNEEKAIKLLKDLDLDINLKINKMSKGMQEKLQLILVMSREAELYILDEPLGGVDPATRDYILDTILLNFNEGASLIISTHIISDVERILDDVIFIDKGEIIAFIGPNGAGKSTTIKMLTGILCPSSGRAMVSGINPAKQRKKLAYKIGTVFGQKEQLWTHLTPYDNFKFFGAIYDLKDYEIEKRIKELNDTLELNDFINTPVRNLSLGQRIRCEIAASLIHKPEILFLDEPTIGLDPVVKENIRVLIKRMNKEFGTTIFLTSHDVGDIEKLCKRVIIINDGKVVLDDSMSNLKYNYLNKKIIEVKMKEKVNLSDEDGITVLKDKGYSLKLSIDVSKKSVSDVIKMLDTDKIIDINISNEPLENIIANIYKGSK